jgi:hypothetical protein
MRVRFAKQNAFKSKPKPPQYIIPPGLSKSAADAAATANRVIDNTIARTIAGEAASSKSAPLSKRSKPAAVKFSALQGLTFDAIVDAYLQHFPAKAAR